MAVALYGIWTFFRAVSRPGSSAANLFCSVEVHRGTRTGCTPYSLESCAYGRREPLGAELAIVSIKPRAGAQHARSLHTWDRDLLCLLGQAKCTSGRRNAGRDRRLHQQPFVPAASGVVKRYRPAANHSCPPLLRVPCRGRSLLAQPGLESLTRHAKPCSPASTASMDSD